MCVYQYRGFKAFGVPGLAVFNPGFHTNEKKSTLTPLLAATGLADESFPNANHGTTPEYPLNVLPVSVVPDAGSAEP